MVFPEPGIGARLLPGQLAAFVTDSTGRRASRCWSGETSSRPTRTTVTTGSGRTIEADAVVAGLGIEPSTELAEAAGLAVDNGIVVDELGQVDGRADVFAAGDVASFPVPALGRRMRVEHEDHANSHGRAVGANMAGADEPYDHLPFFYSDLFELGYEAVGEVDSRLDTVERVGRAEPEGGRRLRRRRAAARAGSCSGTCGARSTRRRELIRAGEPLDSVEHV